MLNQSFSAENFRKILDTENRKGLFLEGRFFPEIKVITDSIKECTENIKNKKKLNSPVDEIDKLYEERKQLKEKKEQAIYEQLQKISENIVKTDFKIELTKKDIPKSKSLYIVKNSPEHYFTLKQLQINFSRSFIVKQSNRFEIISQVKTLLNDTFPKYILRTDIDDFYENIPHKGLLERINANHIISPFSRKILRQILSKYKDLSGNKIGIPRGIGISANLSELYMRDIDREIMSLKGLIYYARYVDDIIIIFVPTLKDKNRDYVKEIKDILQRYELKLNTVKTDKFDLRNTQKPCVLEYLGYKIYFGDAEVKTRLTDKKILKYTERIDSAFNNYLHFSKINEKEARKLLVKRLRFLTGNTRLKGNKRNILVGIYYSNSQLNEKTDLKDIDDYLTCKINNEIKIPQLQRRLKKYSFEKGFDTKNISAFKTHELQKIMKVWQ